MIQVIIQSFKAKSDLLGFVILLFSQGFFFQFNFIFKKILHNTFKSAASA